MDKSSPNDKASQNMEDEKWGTMEKSIEHHRLSKLYNNLNQRGPDVKWISMSNCEVDSVAYEVIHDEESKRKVDCADLLWTKLSRGDGKEQHVELNSNVLGSNSDDSVSETRGLESLQSKVPQTDLSRVPDLNLLENILSRTRAQKENTINDDKFQIDLKSIIPPLDLSWLEKDEWRESKESLNSKEEKNRSDIDLKLMKQNTGSIDNVNSKANHLHLCQAESDPLVGSPDLVPDASRSNCSSPERLEHDPDDDCELKATNADHKYSRFTSPIISEPRNTSPETALKRNILTNLIIKKESQDSGFQEFAGSKLGAGVHSNGNQNSKLRRKCLYRRAHKSIGGKPETIAEESVGISEVIKNNKFSAFESFRSNQEIKWNTIDNIDLPFSKFRQMADERSLSIRINEPTTSLDTSQVSFNVSRHGDTLLSDIKPKVVESPRLDGAKSEANHNSKVALNKTKKGVKVMDKWSEEEEEEEESVDKRKSIKRCYCFICGVNCEIWFC